VAASPAAQVDIRVARSEDVQGVLELWARARSAAATTPDDAAGVGALIAHGTDALLVAEDGGRIVGALVAAWDGWRGNMYRLAVVPERRRLGIGRRLVEAGHERLRGHGARRVTALVDHDEVEATALWRAVGYELDPELARFVRNL
jgi:ribosomal protein S18 acetylase RimI-like enzyme